jgi:hypothetical protein
MPLHLLFLLQMLNRQTYKSIPPVMLTKEIEIRGPQVQRPLSAAIWGPRLAIIGDDGVDGDMVLLFDLRTGAYLGQLARRGAGPGELRAVRVARALPDGSLLTVDVSNARIAWWIAGQAKPRKETPMTGSNWFDAVPWRGDTLLFSSELGNQRSAGFPLHQFVDGRVVRSFGTDKPHLEVGNSGEVLRNLSSPNQGCWWAIPYDRRYVIDCYDAGGRSVRQIVRNPDWYSGWPLHQPRPHERLGRCRVRQYTHASALQADGAGLVWVAFVTPRKDYADKAPCANDPLGRLGDYVEMPLEVFDAKSGQLLGSSTLDAYVAAISADGRVVTYDEDNDDPVITVWRARLSNDRAKGRTR